MSNALPNARPGVQSADARGDLLDGAVAMQRLVVLHLAVDPLQHHHRLVADGVRDVRADARLGGGERVQVLGAIRSTASRDESLARDAHAVLLVAVTVSR